MSRKDLIYLEGKAIKMVGGGSILVECDNGATLTGILSGNMKRNRIKVIPGDRVKIAISPYDITHGLITYRLK